MSELKGKVEQMNNPKILSRFVELQRTLYDASTSLNLSKTTTEKLDNRVIKK